MNLPEESTVIDEEVALTPAIQQRPTLNWVCHFKPSYMSTLKFIHSFYLSSLPRGNA